MRKFNLEVFQKHKRDNDTYCRYTAINNGNTIEISCKEHQNSCQETITFLNTPIKKRYMYNKQTLNQIKEMETFYDCIIGFRKEYNETGELTKEIDCNEPYKFSWQDLVLKMKKEYDIDLMDFRDQNKKNNNVSSVSRNSEEMKYYITLPLEFTPHGATEQKFEIDATTGKVIKHTGDTGKRNLIKNNLTQIYMQNKI